ncbi:hypothetical protein HYZ98_01115 [Candidatus Peregrinibacteria bacterium]|nr:hypothetical protein [Candidatus Peregrinibacteria bacterium]
MKSALSRPQSVAIIALTMMIGGIGTVGLLQVYGNTPVAPVSHFGIEHANPLTLSVVLRTSSGKWGIIDFGSITDETIFISLPDTWRRREVRSVPLSDVQADPPSFGFVRYTFPPQAVVSFIVPDLPDHLLLHNPSNVPIQLNLTNMNTSTKVATHDVILMQESPKEIW